jgi:hypothetical protein
MKREIKNNMFEKLETKKHLTLGFIVRLQKGHYGTYYVPKGELKLGENRLVLGENALLQKSIDFTPCQCGCLDNPPYRLCSCEDEWFFYGEKLGKSIISDNEGAEITEVDIIPDWTKKDFKQALAEKESFREQWLKDHPEPKPPKKKTRWERFCEIFSDGDDFDE